jgi:hypothetical protein
MTTQLGVKVHVTTGNMRVQRIKTYKSTREFGIKRAERPLIPKPGARSKWTVLSTLVVRINMMARVYSTLEGVRRSCIALVLSGSTSGFHSWLVRISYGALLTTCRVLSVISLVLRIRIRATLLVRVELARLGLILCRIKIYVGYDCLVSVEPFNHIGRSAFQGRFASYWGKRGIGGGSTVVGLVEFLVFIIEVGLVTSATTISPQCPQHGTNEDTSSNQTNHQESTRDSTSVSEKPATK